MQHARGCALTMFSGLPQHRDNPTVKVDICPAYLERAVLLAIPRRAVAHGAGKHLLRVASRAAQPAVGLARPTHLVALGAGCRQRPVV